ncbi:MAG: sugar ABC transporter ATP-binding protein [Pirellulaceae bacterium]|nr:sugar ABC transporter ATP-binding protein [Planctomycetales bacterium]
MTEPADVLTARGIFKSFPGVRALGGVDISVRAGRLNALLGENGAGKSTLMNILSGVYQPDRGELFWQGRRIRFCNPREAQAAGIAIIHQELNLIPGLTVTENVFLGREPITRWGTIDLRRMIADTETLLHQLRLEINPAVPVGRLPVGSQQLVEIAKALSSHSRVLIMDEPTSALSEQEIRSLFRLIKQLKSDGVGLIYITHKLDELSEIADDVTILRDGTLVASVEWGRASTDDLVRWMVGRDLSELYPKTECATGDEVLAVERMTLANSSLPGSHYFQDVSFSVCRGEVVGLFGLMGAGRTELLQTIFGLHPRASSGKVRVNGVEVAISSPPDAIQAGIALAPEDRKAEGLVMPMDVGENTVLARGNRDGAFGWIARNAEQRLAQQMCDRLKIKTPSLSQLVSNLSGGNQQKVVLAKWLATAPRILMLDEPTRGIDINAKKEIYSLIDELVHQGIGVLMVSSELPEILALSDRILVLAGGRIAGEFVRGEASEEDILAAAFQRR